MEGLRQYAVSVVSAALICGIVSRLSSGGASKEILRLLSGIFLAFAVLAPIARVDLGQLELPDLLDASDAASISQEGADAARKSMAALIQEHTEAYIVDKATALHASLSAQVTVSDDEIPIPVAVRLTGVVSPNVRRQMEDFIQEELGITRENQKWTG